MNLYIVNSIFSCFQKRKESIKDEKLPDGKLEGEVKYPVYVIHCKNGRIKTHIETSYIRFYFHKGHLTFSQEKRFCILTFVSRVVKRKNIEIKNKIDFERLLQTELSDLFPSLPK